MKVAPPSKNARSSRPLIQAALTKPKSLGRRCTTKLKPHQPKYIHTARPLFHHNLQPLPREERQYRNGFKMSSKSKSKPHPQLPARLTIQVQTPIKPTT